MAFIGVMKAVNELVYETKHSAVDELVKFLEASNNLHLDQEFHSQVQSFKKTIKIEKVNATRTGELKSPPKKKDRPKRTPSSFNIFIREAMLKLKESQPDLNNTDRMRAAIALWNEDKKKKGI
jgi:hypothetical protein